MVDFDKQFEKPTYRTDARLTHVASVFQIAYGWMCAGLALSGLVAWYTASSGLWQKVLVGPGLDIAAARNHNGCIRVDMENAVISNFEPADGAFGSIMTAILLCPKAGKAVVASDEMDCLYLLTKPCPEKNCISYWAGSSWTGAGTFTKGCQWHAYVKDFAAALRAPIVVSVK